MKLPGPVRKAVHSAYQVTGRRVPNTLQDRGWVVRRALADGIGLEERSCPSRIALFRARDRRYARDEDLGWDEVASGGLEVHEIPGDHNSIFDEPNIDQLAIGLRESLARAQNDRYYDAAPYSQASDSSFS
jgi:thioesterase domain-containing protein